jgi:hypothetical protein
MNFKQWLTDLFLDERGGTSIKPVVGLLGSLFLCITLAVNVVLAGEFQPNERLIDAVLLMTLGAMGGDTWDKFSTKTTAGSTKSPTPKKSTP